MTAERIKTLREQKNITQTELSKMLGISRSSVNAWELGISVPSTQFIVELSDIFHVSTDYLLCVNKTASIGIADLNESDIALVYALIEHLRSKNRERSE